MLEAFHWVFQHTGMAVSGQVFAPNWMNTSTAYTQANASSADYAQGMHNAITVQPLREVQDGSDNARMAIAVSATLANCRLRVRFFGDGGTFTLTIEELTTTFSKQNDYILIDPSNIDIGGFENCYIVVDAQVPTSGTAYVANYSLVAGLIPAGELPRGR